MLDILAHGLSYQRGLDNSLMTICLQLYADAKMQCNYSAV